MNSAAEVQRAAVAATTQDSLVTTRDTTEAVAHQVLQTLAHDLRQPLSAIESTAYYLGLVLQRGDAQAREHATRLRKLVEQANWILSCGLQFSDASPLSPQPVDLEDLITDIVATRISDDTHLSLDFSGKDSAGSGQSESLGLVQLDVRRMRKLIENLLDLLEEAGKTALPVRIRTAAEPSTESGTPAGVLLEMSVAAVGLQSAASLGCGSSLCLDGAKRIVEAHGGEFGCSVDPADGVRLRMVLR
jgi:signal transduction histidine kinase